MIETATWHSLNTMAIHRRHDGDLTGAIASLQKAIAMTRDLPELARETSTMLNYLADIYLTEGSLDQAEETIRQALERTVAEPLFFADNLLILAKILHKCGRHPESLEAAHEGLRIVRKEYGRTHGYTINVEALVKEMTSGNH
jgi:tetratricopeptide (TPR) repeat protein